MDKLSIISGTLFMLAGVFAVTSLAMPEWIVTEVRHPTHLLPSILRDAGRRYILLISKFINFRAQRE